MSHPEQLTHYVSLAQPGGVERHFAEFIQYTVQNERDWRHSLIVAGQPLHPFIRPMVSNAVATGHEKYLNGIKLPSKPAFIRRWHCRRLFKRLQTQRLLIWNRPARSENMLRQLDVQNCLYWEHGAAWFTRHSAIQQKFYQRVPYAITNSFAAKRLLELRWGFKGEITVCLNALRPSLLPTELSTKNYTHDRPFRLGCVGRLISIKGIPLILHAVKHLLVTGRAVQLHIAGSGPMEDKIRDLVVRLDLEKHVFLHGLLDSMSAFYQQIDCLVHPALREPFGLVCIEAAAYGCPVIATRVDGLPEAVQHEVSGYCLEPTLSIKHYQSLGGEINELPPYVYNPAVDDITAPLAVDPLALAEKVEFLLDNDSEYRRLSSNAKDSIKNQFDFAQHVKKVMKTIGEYS